MVGREGMLGGLIEYVHGELTALGRIGLEAVACSCHAAGQQS